MGKLTREFFNGLVAIAKKKTVSDPQHADYWQKMVEKGQREAQNAPDSGNSSQRG